MFIEVSNYCFTIITSIHYIAIPEKFSGVIVFFGLKFNFLRFASIKNEFLFIRVVRLFFFTNFQCSATFLFIDLIRPRVIHGFFGVDL